MKFLVLNVLASAFFLSCQPSASNEKVIKATLSTEAVEEDTIKPASNFYIPTSRPQDKISSEYPYNIALLTADGDTVNSAAVLQTQKPTVLLFWLTTCGPCRMELQALQGIYDTYSNKADFDLVAISTDFPKNYTNFVKRVRESNWPWKAYNDVNREFRLIMPGALNGLPQTFIIDRDGKIVYHKRKYRPGDELILMEKILEIAEK